jgi:serine/threonine-protein kinase RsbW
MYKATFPGRYKSLAKISEFVSRAIKEAGFDETTAYTVLVAVDEACTNIIEHAYGGEEQGDIQCSCEVSEDSITIILRDRGKPFDPTTVPEPNFAVPIEQLECHGAGLVLIQRIMDEIHFSSTPEGENVLTMVKLK